MKKLHDRQPVIVDQTYYDAWLDPATPKGHS
jgi:putative SOS response-associated peptidase YedK